ncbi:CARDB domain-containing protein [Patulibacter minatonensis]|uniref:CARDB domain-containing protein n=1 Tax=Patulibacter minatonensis TaxID=298163 RepID=UPI0006878946|nr:CARDB domain-containing protein [Patulibacter minatonensis]
MTTASPVASLRSSAPRIRRTPALLAALLGALVVLGLAAVPAANAADRNFAPRFSVNDTGDIDIFGNTLMTCPTSAAGCTAAQRSGVTTTSDSMNQNNAYSMQYVDVDGDPSTFNSSRATVTIPTGSTVLFAGLYWGGRAGGATGFAQRGTVKFKAPTSSAYVPLTATTLDDGGTAGASDSIYQGFVDVTSRVQAGGSGVYTVADVQAALGGDKLAGWSLVIAYRDTSQPARNLTVFDGIKSISGTQGGTIPVSGFLTPPAGAVKTRVGFVAYEGDAGIVGDSASLNGTILSDAQHPATNFFNSRSSRDGVLRTATDPNYPNNLGIEQSILKADGILPNNATSATIGLTTSGDVYAPGVVTFATELYAPKVDQTKKVEDVNGGLVEQGDTLRYTIEGTNSGQDGAASFVLRDPIPANTTYVPGTLRISPATGGAATVTPTDAVDADRGEFDATGNRVVARLGTGSTGTSGGTVPAGGTYTVTFDVKVGGPSPAIASDTDIKNVATASFASSSLGTPLTAQSDATATVQSPDLTITKVGQGPITRGQPHDYVLTVKNIGDAPTQGQYSVTDTLPAGVTATSVDAATGWTCSITNSSKTVTCTRTTALAVGGSSLITLHTQIAASAPTPVVNSATVAGGGDGNPTNNVGTDNAPAGSQADLSITKSTPTTAPAVGENVVYTLTVKNNGTSDSTGSVVTDTLPAGLTFVSSSSGCTGTSTISCTVGALAAGDTKALTITAKPAVGTAGKPIKNTAAVTGNEPDPSSANNTGDQTVTVKPVDLVVTNAIAGTPTPTTLQAGNTYTWQVDVKNTGGSPATGSTLAFPVPAGTSVDGQLPNGCTLSVDGRTITCTLGTIAPGASVPTLNIPLKVDSTNPPASVSTIATATSLEQDANVDDNSATTSTPVVSAVDLGVTLASNPGSTSAGDTLTLTATVKNNGPASPQNPKVTVAIPAGTTFVSAPSGCTYDAAAQTVVCDLSTSDLGSGKSTTRDIVVKVGSNPGATIDSSARVTTVNDTDPSNDTAALQVPVVRVAGLSITKSASSANAKPGDTVTYTLKASNAGPAAAQDVVIDDVIPAGTTFVSADAPCTFSSGKVTCAVGDIAAGSSRSVAVRVQVSPLAGSFDANATQDLDVQKKEVDVAIQPKSANTAQAGTVTCDPGYFATDGSARLEHVDQGTGNLGDLHVRASRATVDGTGWTAIVDNDTIGQGTLKVTVVCLKTTTASSGGHTHPLLVSAPVTATRQLAAGRTEVVLACGTGRVAVAPSFTFVNGGSARVSGSQRDGQTGWKFTVDTTEADSGTFSVRCLSTTTGAVNGHVHDLQFTQLNDTIVVPANQTGSTKTTKTLDCQSGKGIVGGSLVPPGLTSAGNDPQPQVRVFGFQNTTGQDLTANVSLLCLGIRTGGELGFANVVNTASVKTSTQDATTADDTASATFTATNASGDTGTVTPAPTPTPVAPRPVAPATPVAPAPSAAAPDVAAPPTTAPRAAVLATSLRVSGTTTKASVAVPVSCSVACTGTAKLVALGPVKASATIKKGSVLATGTLKLKAGKKTTVRLSAKGKGAKALRLGRVAKAQLVITTGKGTTVKKTVRISIR